MVMTMNFNFIKREPPLQRITHMLRFRSALTGSLLALALGCSSETQSNESMPEEKAVSKEDGSLVIFSGRSEDSVGALFEMFEQQSGVELTVHYDKTPAMAERLHTEGAQSPADVFLAQDSGYLGALADADLLQTLPEGLADRVIDGMVAPDNHWVATSGRMRVLVYSPERVPESELPATLWELTETSYRVGWAPSNSSFQTHVSALRATWGDEKTRDWLGKMAQLNPSVYPKNSPQVNGVSKAEIDIGWVNHYYLHRLKAQDPSLKAANYHFTTDGDEGNLMMLSGVAMTRATQRATTAESFMAFLLSDEAQQFFTEKGYEYPTVQGIARHPDLPPAMSGRLDVDQEKLADVGKTVEMLRDLKLQ